MFASWEICKITIIKHCFLQVKITCSTIWFSIFVQTAKSGVYHKLWPRIELHIQHGQSPHYWCSSTRTLCIYTAVDLQEYLNHVSNINDCEFYVEPQGFASMMAGFVVTKDLSISISSTKGLSISSTKGTQQVLFVFCHYAHIFHLPIQWISSYNNQYSTYYISEYMSFKKQDSSINGRRNTIKNLNIRNVIT